MSHFNADIASQLISYIDITSTILNFNKHMEHNIH